jgi:hypothetical protein
LGGFRGSLIQNFKSGACLKATWIWRENVDKLIVRCENDYWMSVNLQPVTAAQADTSTKLPATTTTREAA